MDYKIKYMHFTCDSVATSINQKLSSLSEHCIDKPTG